MGAPSGDRRPQFQGAELVAGSSLRTRPSAVAPGGTTRHSKRSPTATSPPLPARAASSLREPAPPGDTGLGSPGEPQPVDALVALVGAACRISNGATPSKPSAGQAAPVAQPTEQRSGGGRTGHSQRAVATPAHRLTAVKRGPAGRSPAGLCARSWTRAPTAQAIESLGHSVAAGWRRTWLDGWALR